MIVGAGAEAHLRHGMFEVSPRVIVDFAMLANEPRRQGYTIGHGKAELAPPASPQSRNPLAMLSAV